MPPIKDLTQGDPGQVLIRFTLPLFLSVFFQQLYNIADSAIAGTYIGEDALAAIGASYPITMLFMAVAVGSQIGCSVALGRLYGRKLFRRVRSCITTALISSTVLSLLLTLFGVLASDRLMLLVHTPENILENAASYLKIYTSGFLFVHLYNVITGLFSSLGDSKTPLYLLIFSSLGNIALDLLFVIVLQRGVAGLAWATLTAQAAACLLSLMLILRRLHQIPKDGRSPLFSFRDLGDIQAVAVPSILQQSFISVGNLIIQTFINPFGSSVIAGYSAAIKLNTFALTCFTNMSSGISSFTAQNLGAGSPERVRKGFSAALKMACGTALVFSTLYLLCGSGLLRLFMNQESTQLALETGRRFMLLTAPAYPIICIKIIADGVLRGSGSMGYFMTATLVDLVLRVLLAWIFSRIFSETGIWMAWPISWAIATVLSIIFYRKGVWQKHIERSNTPAS